MVAYIVNVNLFIYLCVCDEKSKLLSRTINPILSDLVMYVTGFAIRGLPGL